MGVVDFEAAAEAATEEDTFRAGGGGGEEGEGDIIKVFKWALSCFKTKNESPVRFVGLGPTRSSRSFPSLP